MQKPLGMTESVVVDTSAAVTTAVAAAAPAHDQPPQFAQMPPIVPAAKQSSSSAKPAKKKDKSLRKSPLAPKRFKSSYICYFTEKQPEVREKMGNQASVADISAEVASMWKKLPQEERAHWDDMAAKDKERYNFEKATYVGPWRVPWKRAKKDPSAPKRNMSAFLYFSQTRRTILKQKHPDMKNTEISRLLGKMWREATPEEKEPYVEREKEEREKYKVAISEWKKTNDEKVNEQRAELSSNWVPNLNMNLGNPNVPNNPFMFGQIPPPAFASFPNNSLPAIGNAISPGKRPIILGPNGMPYYPTGGFQLPPTAMPPPPPVPTENLQAVPDPNSRERSDPPETRPEGLS